MAKAEYPNVALSDWDSNLAKQSKHTVRIIGPPQVTNRYFQACLVLLKIDAFLIGICHITPGISGQNERVAGILIRLHALVMKLF